VNNLVPVTCNFNQTTKPYIKTTASQNLNTLSNVESSVEATTTNITATGTPTDSSANKRPFKRQFHKDSIVIPPALNNNDSIEKINELTQTKSSNIVSEKSLRAHSHDTSSTVHWNKTTSTAPPPSTQIRPSDVIGGQTSNMLYCRRINPALNPNQHVMVGKLGSLGRVNLPRFDAEKANSSEKTNPEVSGKTTNQPSSTNSSKQSFVSSEAVCENDKVLNASQKAGAPWTTTQLGLTKSDPSSPVSSSPQLRDLSNQPLPINTEPNSRDNVSHTTLLPCDPVIRHGSRKSDHSQMLKDPDFCESPPNILTKELPNDAQKCCEPKYVTFGVKFDETNLDSSSTSEGISRDLGNSTAGNKCPRAAILRK